MTIDFNALMGHAPQAPAPATPAAAYPQQAPAPQQYAPPAPPPAAYAPPGYAPPAPPPQQYAPQAPPQQYAPPGYAPPAPPPQQYAPPPQYGAHAPAPPVDPMIALQGLEKAQRQSGGGDWFPADATFLVQLDALKIIMSPKHGQMFVSEWTVLESTSPALPQGARASHSIKIMGNFYAWEDIRNVLVALLGLDENMDAAKITAEIMPNILTITAHAINTGALNGRRVRLITRTKTTGPSPKNGMQGGKVTKHSYSRVLA